LAKDLLFATLDPTMRGLRLPGGTRIILSDTVGFIADLPTELVAAFRATLEEVLEAEVVLHVRDAAHEESEIQKADVEAVLASLGLMGEKVEGAPRPLVEVLNKIDSLDAAYHEAVVNAASRDAMTVALSALTGEGVADLLALIDSLIIDRGIPVRVILRADEGEALAWFYEHGQVRKRDVNDDGSTALEVSLPEAEIGRLEKRFPALHARIAATAPKAAE
jgi:GTP-binding protein HflX